MELELKNKTVLVTGASRGIGLKIAQAFLGEGAVVVLNDILETELEQAAAQLRAQGGKAHGYCFDISDETRAKAGVAAIGSEVGPIDVLVNNAGITKRHSLEAFPIDEWRKVIDVNLTGAMIVAQACAAQMIPRGSGKIINITSLNAELCRPSISAYCAAKGGLKMLTKSMAAEWGGYGINVNAIGPGYIHTDISAPLAEDPKFDAWVKSEVPLGRWGTTDDLTGAALFLASPAADYITGQTLYIDGGWQSSL